MKFIKQKTKHDCAPVALMNAFIFFDKKVSYRQHILWFKEISKYQDYYGVDIKDFTRMMLDNKTGTFPFNVQYLIKKPTIKQLREHVNKTQCVILGFHFENYAHVGLIIGFSKKYVTLVNWGSDKAVTKMTIKNFKKYLSEWALAYVLEKPVDV